MMQLRMKSLAAIAVSLMAFSLLADTYVSPAGAGDGASPESPTTLQAALASVGEGAVIRLAAGEYAVTSAEGLTLSVPATLIGGENGSGGAVISTALEGVRNLFSVDVPTGTVKIEGVTFANCKGRGFNFNGGADLTLRNCRFENCGGRGRWMTGHGANLVGTGSNTVTLENCTFDRCRDNSWANNGSEEMRGMALFAENLAKLKLENVLVIRCGASPVYDNYAKDEKDALRNGLTADGVSYSSPEQSVVYMKSAPVEAKGVRFVGNTVTGSNVCGGRVLCLTGACGGSTFTDCEWSANDMMMTYKDIYARPKFKETTTTIESVRSRRLSSASRTGSVVIDLNENDSSVGFSGCKFAYNVTGQGWTAGINVVKGAATISNGIFWGNVISSTWGQYSDLLVCFNGRASVDHTLFGGYGGRYFQQDDPYVTLGEGMKYGDPCFATGKAAFIRNYLSFDPNYVMLDETTFPHPAHSMKDFDDTQRGHGNEVVLVIANGSRPDDFKPLNGKVAPIDSLDTTVSTAAGVFKTAPTAALGLASVDVTFPLDLKPRFKVTTGGGDAATVECRYSFTAPTDANNPNAYAHAVNPGLFGAGVSFDVPGPTGAEKPGSVVYWLVRTANAAGTQVRTGSSVADGAAPTVWSTRQININPEPVVASTDSKTLSNWKLHYAFNDGTDGCIGSTKIGSAQNAEWFQHNDDPAWGRDRTEENTEPVPDWLAVVKPVDGEQEGRPLVVSLHGRGGGMSGFYGILSGLGNPSSIYHTPTNCYGLVLDDRENALNDFWWGAMPPASTAAGMTSGGLLNQVNLSYYSFAYGAQMGGELNAGPSLTPFKFHTMTCLDWCHRGEPPAMKRVMDTIEWAIRKYKIDRNRVYLCGNSMGGQGTLAIGLKHGEVFAAINGNVPATIVYPASQMGFIGEDGKDVDYAAFRRPDYDPPVCLDWSGSNDAWSRDHDIMYRNMNRFRYSYIGWWGNHGHIDQVSKAVAVNDLTCSFDWLSVRKNEAYPAFSNSEGNQEYPWPQKAWTDADQTGGQITEGVEAAAGTIVPRDGSDLVGQWNSWYRWEVVQDAADRFEMDIWIASAEEMPTEMFTRPKALKTDVTLRRLQNFPRGLPEGEAIWVFGDGQSGKLVWDDHLGAYTMEQLEITQSKRRLVFAKTSSSAPIVLGTFGEPSSNSVPFTADVIALGSGASQLTSLRLVWGTDPAALDQSMTLPQTAVGAKDYVIKGLTYLTTYYFRLEADNGLADGKTAVDLGSVKTAGPWAPGTKLADFPEAVLGLVYDGTEKTGVAAGTGYQIMGNTATDADSYVATLTLDPDRVWSDGSTDRVRTLAWSIRKAVNVWTTAAKIAPDAWIEGGTAGTLTVPVAKFGDATKAATLNGAAWDGVTLPAKINRYVAKWTVEETKNYGGLTAEVAFSVQVNGDSVNALLEYLRNDDRIVPESPYATGGDLILKDGGTYIHVFYKAESEQTFEASADLAVRALVVGGGGSGGSTCGGGGGAGGLLTADDLAIADGEAWTVLVGAGGASQTVANRSGNAGKSSRIVFADGADLTALGGGAGGAWQAFAGSKGGSGGGGCSASGTGGAGTEGQGMSGGAGYSANSQAYGGGGGGAARSGGTNPGVGGDGVVCAILCTGESSKSYEEQYFAGGGGGSGANLNSALAGGAGGGGKGATANSGAVAGSEGLGGGGGGGNNSGRIASGAGGSGIVVIRYESPDAPGEKKARLPKAENLVYTGELQTGVLASGSGYTVAGNTAVDAGDYVAKVTLAEGYVWADGVEAKTRDVAWSIAAAENEWTTAARISAPSWQKGGPGGVLTVPVAKFGDADKTASLNGSDWDNQLPTAVGTYEIRWKVAATKNYGALETSVAFSITEEKEEPEPPPVEPQELTGVFLVDLANDVRKVAASPAATGGDLILKDGDAYIHVYTNATTATFVAKQSLSASVLIVAGGGAGGKAAGGGGGAGGLIERTGLSAAANDSWTVLVGAGGAGVSAANTRGNKGENSKLTMADGTSLEAIGGGGGGGWANYAGGAGGSGGGSCNDTAGVGTNGQGHDGGTKSAADGQTYGGGGGGAGGVGGTGEGIPGTGGAGKVCAILGGNFATQCFAGGGGSGANIWDAAKAGKGGAGGGGAGAWGSASAVSGENGLGAGGGGVGNQSCSSGAGGSGIVVIRYSVGGGAGGLEIRPGETSDPYDTDAEARSAAKSAVLMPREEVAAVFEGASEKLAHYKSQFCFKVTPSGEKWVVESALTEEAASNLNATARTATRQIDVAAVAALPSGGTIPLLEVTGCEPGFFYSLYSGSQVTDLRASESEKSRNVLCGLGGSVTFESVEKPSDEKGFFSVGALDSPTVEAESDFRR